MAPHLRYGSSSNVNDDLLKKLADMIENQFGIKKNITHSYKQPCLEWFNRVELPDRWRVPDFTKFTGQDNIATIEHISRYLAQL